MDRYTVIRSFWDDVEKHRYSVGDDYPYDGHAASSRRIEELSTTNNKLGKQYIAKIDPIEVTEPPAKLKRRGKRIEVDPLPEPAPDQEGGEYDDD